MCYDNSMLAASGSSAFLYPSLGALSFNSHLGFPCCIWCSRVRVYRYGGGLKQTGVWFFVIISCYCQLLFSNTQKNVAVMKNFGPVRIDPVLLSPLFVSVGSFSIIGSLIKMLNMSGGKLRVCKLGMLDFFSYVRLLSHRSSSHQHQRGFCISTVHGPYTIT